jgi:hypothetical protein
MSDVLAKPELEEAASYLLTSSTVSRYIRLAREVANRSTLAAQLRSDPDFSSRLAMYARERWLELSSSPQRDVQEVELAIILPLLARAPLPSVEALLSDVGLSVRPSAAWIGALARHLISERPTNTQRQISARRDASRSGLMLSSSHLESQELIISEPMVVARSPRGSFSQSQLRLAA